MFCTVVIPIMWHSFLVCNDPYKDKAEQKKNNDYKTDTKQDKNTQEISILKYKQKRPHIKVGLDSFLPGQLTKANFGLWVPPIKLLNGWLWVKWGSWIIILIVNSQDGASWF